MRKPSKDDTTAAPAGPLRVTVGPLLDTTGVAHTVRWTLDAAPGNEPVTVAAFGTVALHVEAHLPADDVYAGEIALAYAGRRETTRLTAGESTAGENEPTDLRERSRSSSRRLHGSLAPLRTSREPSASGRGAGSASQ